MSDISCQRMTYVEDYGVNMEEVFMKSSAAGRIGKGSDVEKAKTFNADNIIKLLQCKRNETHYQVTVFIIFLSRQIFA